MRAWRAALPIVLLGVFVYLQVAPRPVAPAELREAIAPQPAHGLAVADAPATIEELRQRVAAVLRREGVHGAAIALVDRNGPIWIGGVGVANVETGAPVDGDTVFRVGSLSKAVIALGVMRLADQGKLDVDRPLRELLPGDVDNRWEAGTPVTLAQCLEHTAGLDDVRFNEIFTDDETLSVRDTLALNPRSRVVRWRPGTRSAYSNVGYTLAGRAIEVAAGEPFDSYLRREILDPIGMRDAEFRRTPANTPHLATGYLEPDRPAAFRMFAHRPSGALLASANDLAALVRFWIRRGDGYPAVVSPAGLARIERSGTLPYPHLDTQYGFANYGDVSHPVIGRGHDGGMPGFHSSMRYFPELGVGYALLLNSTYAFRGYFEIRSLLYSFLARGRAALPAPAAPVAAVEPPRAEFFAYASPHNEVFGFIDRVRVGWRAVDVPGGVQLQELRGDAYQLFPTDDGGYRFSWESGTSVQFTTNRDGVPVFVMHYLYAEASSWWLAWLRNAALSLAYLLVTYAPLWAAAMLGLGVVQRRRVLHAGLVLWPAIAGLSWSAFPQLLETAFHHGVIGVVHPLTVAVCALTSLIAIAAAGSLVSVVRWSLRPDRPRAIHLVVPTACAIAASGVALWFGVNGLIGLRTWSW